MAHLVSWICKLYNLPQAWLPRPALNPHQRSNLRQEQIERKQATGFEQRQNSHLVRNDHRRLVRTNAEMDFFEVLGYLGPVREEHGAHDAPEQPG